MKKIIILLGIIFLLSSCFLGKVEKQSFNVEKNSSGTIDDIRMIRKNENSNNIQNFNLKEECNKVVRGEKSSYLANTKIYFVYKKALLFLENDKKIAFYKDFINGIRKGGDIFLKKQLDKIPKNKLGYIAISDYLNGTDNCLKSSDKDRCIELYYIIKNVSKGNIKKIKDLSYIKSIVIYNNFNLKKTQEYINNIFLDKCYKLK